MPESENKIRLQLFLSRCGVASRRKAAILIDKGKVSVNGKIVREAYHKIDPDTDKVLFEGKALKLTKYKFFKLCKPVGVLSAMKDSRGRRTIAHLIPKSYGKLFPVGRLDLDSEGLLILTNHGEAANRMMHPRYHFPKIYHVSLDKSPTKEDLVRMSRGVDIDGKRTMPGAYELIGNTGTKRVRVEIVEGRKRQIKMVFRKLDYRVVKLKRLSIGPIKLGNMKPGEIRDFTMDELFNLLGSLGLAEI